MKHIIEAGHYYESMGPCELSIGWKINLELANNCTAATKTLKGAQL